jgi:two-component system NtrC family sensor kinase
MNLFPVPLKVVIVGLLTSILVIVGIMNLQARISWLDPTDGVFWGETNHELSAVEIASGSPGASAGIRSGDVLVSFDGQPIRGLEMYYGLLYGRGRDAKVSYVVRSGDLTREISLRLASKSLVTPKDAMKSLLAFLHLFIGLFVLFRGGRQPRAFHFYLLCLAGFVTYLYSWTPRLDLLDWSVYWLSIAALLLLPALFVHFCLRFPVASSRGHSSAPLLYLAAVCLGTCQILWLTGHLAEFGLPRTAGASGFLDRIHLVYFCTGFLGGGVLLAKRWAGATDLTTRQQMKWVCAGTLSAIIPFSLIYVIPILLGAPSSLAIESALLFLGLIPLTFAYAIVHYRLLDVEILVRRGVAYFIASTTLLLLYLFFVLVIGHGVQWIAPQADFLIICLVVLAIALLFAPLRDRIQARLDRVFYKDRFQDRSSLLDFSRTLGSQIDMAPLANTILQRISKTFAFDRVALFLTDPVRRGLFRLSDALGPDGQEVSRLISAGRELVIHDIPEDPATQERTSSMRRAPAGLMDCGFEHVLELRRRERTIGMIGLGPLPRHRHLSTEDLDLLEALAGYAAIALENANLYRAMQARAMEFEQLKVYTENILESINVAVLALDPGGRVTACNRAFEELFRTDRDQVIGSPIESILARDIISALRKVTETIGWELKSPGNLFKIFLENREGERLIVNLSIIPLLNSTEFSSGSVIVLDDISAKVRLEDQLLQAEKLSSIGLLAAGIAHEVNTPITGISSYTQMLLKETSDGDRRKPILEKIERQTFRAAEIVNGLLNFARMNGSEYRDLDLNVLLRDSLALLDHQIKQNHIKLAYSLADNLPQVYGNSGKLQQVFINLILNARDAMPAGGELRIETALNESMVIVDIEDTGVGISAENIKKIYDPFFTTKGVGTGTGLGLAVTYGIIQEHGGRILVDSMPGKGTRFRLKLPTRQLRQTAS